MEYDVIIIGAGPAGIMAGMTLCTGKKLRVALIDEHDAIGSKLVISGGGKCNITNTNMHPKYYSAPEFVKYALKAYGDKTMHLIEDLCFPTEVREHGRVFFRSSASKVVEKLYAMLISFGIKIHTLCTVQEVSSVQGGYMCKTSKGIMSAGTIIIATGSTAWKKNTAYPIKNSLQKLGHSVLPFSSALAPLYLTHNSLNSLSGISLPVRITSSTNAMSIEDTLLFTHKGISGPAVLRISSYWIAGEALEINFLPDCSVRTYIQQMHKKTIKNMLQCYLPNRLVEAIIPEYLYAVKCAEITKQHKVELEECIHHYTIYPTAIAPLHFAEVAHGGVSHTEVSSKTMESKLCPNMYIIGEALDIVGDLGGYNIHFAFSSGFLAGSHICGKN